MMRIYCELDAVLLANPKLEVAHVLPYMPNLIEEACLIVKDDLSGTADMEGVDKLAEISPKVRRLAIYKSRELGYAKYYGAERPDKSEADDWKNEYNSRLKDIRQLVREEKLDMLLQEIKENVRPRVKFL